MAEKEEEEEEADWSNLPFDLMEEIFKELEYTSDISDYARLAAVCVSWQQAYNLDVPVIHRQLPVLIIPTSSTTTLSSSDQEDEFRSFYRITDGKVYDSFKFRMPSYMWCYGSSLGWLVTVDNRDLSVRLFNPFLSLSANNEILLPSLNHFPSDPDYGTVTKRYLVKAVLSADPLSNPDNYIVMAMYGWSRLAFFRPGDKAWTPIGPKSFFADVIYYSGEKCIYEDGFFHAVAVDGTLLARFKVADILAQNVEDKLAENKRQYMGQLIRFHKIPSSLPGNIYKRLYLVQALKTLYLVQRMVDVCNDEETYSTIGFKIFKIDKFEQEEKAAAAGEVEEQLSPSRPKFGWTEVNNLCGLTLFIGCSTSMSILSYGCKPDCIYYTDDYCNGWRMYPDSVPHDMGVFNFVDRSIDQHYRPIDPNTPLRPVPIWIEPSLQKTGGSTYKLMLHY